MDCIASNFTGLNECRQAVGGVFRLFVASWHSDFWESLTIEGDYVTGQTKLLSWRELPINQVTQTDNELLTEGKYRDTITFEVAGFYIEDRAIKEWLNNNRLVFVFVGGNGQAFISGEENGHKAQSFKDSTAGSLAQWTFTANTTRLNYGITNEYLDKIEDTADCDEYTSLLALSNATTIQEQFDCVIGLYDGFIP